MQARLRPSLALLLDRARERLGERDHASDEPARAPLWSLLYLGFLFFGWQGGEPSYWLPATLASVVVFVPLYLFARRQSGARVLGLAAIFATLGFALVPLNASANTYLIYAAALLPFSGIAFGRAIGCIVVMIVLFALEVSLLGWPPRFVLIVTGITAIVAVAVCAANHFRREKDLRQSELKLSHDEVRRLGALAERERIGRDLHDLLGHTLALITIKSELAVRLFDRDPLAARREIADVERVARDALGQVRRAVSGIRTAGLGAELASARLMLESSDIRLDYRLGIDAMPADVETVLALVIRESVTNIQRHARATHATVELAHADGMARLIVRDDGRGGTVTPGNGLNGMRERVESLGGRLEIASTRGGVHVSASVPMPMSAAASIAPPVQSRTLTG